MQIRRKTVIEKHLEDDENRTIGIINSQSRYGKKKKIETLWLQWKQMTFTYYKLCKSN